MSLGWPAGRAAAERIGYIKKEIYECKVLEVSYSYG